MNKSDTRLIMHEALASTINLPPIIDIAYFTLKSELLTLCIN